MRLRCQTGDISRIVVKRIICRATFVSDLNNNKRMYYPKISPVGISHKQENTPRIFITLSFITVVTWKH